MFNNTKKRIFKQIVLIGLLTGVGTPIVEAASPKKNVQEGTRLYEQGDYKAAESKFMEALAKDPESDIVNFNLGTALYKNGNYEQAIDYYQKAFLSNDDALKQKSYYNLGNTFYQLGMEQEKENQIPHAVSSLEKSLNQYKRALSIDEEDEDAKHNYNFVEQELKRLQEIQQQQQQQQGQSDRSEQSQEQENQQSGEGQSQDQQNQQQQGEEEQDQNQEQSQPQSQGTEEEDKNEQNTGEKPQSGSELTEEEARMLLESYQQTEEPQGQLNMQQHEREIQPTLKDW